MPHGVQGWTYAARVYISMWFFDLYVSNREAVKKLSPIAFNQRYRHEILRVSDEYDTYLSLLNASIRPTHIKLTLEDALYIPILAENPNITSPNPFEIPNFVRNEAYFYGFIALMKENKKWNFRAIAGDVLGRPDGCSIGTKPTVYVLGSTWKAILT